MEAKIGDRVSIDPNKRAYFFQTEGGISLSADSESDNAIIPKTVSEEQLKQINMAIRAGHLFIGRNEKSANFPDTDAEIRLILEQGRNKITTWIGELQDDKKIKSTLKIGRLEKVIQFERAGKNRASVIENAENALSYIGGASSVEEGEQEKVVIKIVPGDAVEDEPVEAKTVKVK